MPIAPGKIILTNAEGEPAELPHEVLTDRELETLLKYKKFLQKHGYREAVYCTRCWGNNLADGTEFRVTEHGVSIEAMIRCRCRVAYGRGGSVH